MTSDKLEFDYEHDGQVLHCWAVFEPADESVNIHGGWFVDRAVEWGCGQCPSDSSGPHYHDTYTRDQIEEKFGLAVVHGMDEAAHAVAEGMKADDEEAYANDLDENLEDE